MNLKTSQETVGQWMEQFGQKVEKSPKMPNLETRKLRAKLMLEECLETIVYGLGLDSQLAGHENKISYLEDILNSMKSGEFHFFEDSAVKSKQIRDGLADQLVVVLGTAAACGIDAQSDFEEVMRSNFSKMWTGEEVMHYIEGDGDCPPIRSDAKELTVVKADPNATISTRSYIVKDPSGKVIKSPSYSKPDFK